MSERLTDQQLQILCEQWQPAAIELTELRARVAELETWAKEWHDTAETICLLAGVSQGLGASEMVAAFRDTNDALRARVAKLEGALKPFADVADYEDNPPFWDDAPKTKLDDDDEYWSVFYRDVRAKHFRAARAALKDAPQ